MVLEIAILVVSLILAVIVVNAGQQLLMSILGADTMFFSIKTKLVLIIEAAIFIAGFIGKLFGM